MTEHQRKQKEVINNIEQHIANNSIAFTTVAPVSDFENDSRICLTSVHLPTAELVNKIDSNFITPLKEIAPDYFYYPKESLHMTIKNIRVINDPPNFTDVDIENAKRVYSEILPKHKKFNVYFYRLLLFPTNIALIGTTDPELDSIINDLDEGLKEINLSDDKKYNNHKYFFCNITLARFSEANESFRRKVIEISKALSFPTYTIDSVTLISGNAVLIKQQRYETWKLR